MKIRHALDGQGQEIENRFAAFDDLEAPLGESGVRVARLDMLFPSRPCHFVVDATCQAEALDALLGAATTRALLLARTTTDMPSRIYVECPPEDTVRVEALKTLGYQDDDGLVRMRKRLSRGPILSQVPEHCTVVRDYLLDETESRFFLERYNAMFNREHDEQWLRAIKRQANFARFLVVAPAGLAGELLTWSEGATGVVGVIQVPPAWQRRGAASALLELARLYWLDRGLTEARFDVWTRLIPAVRLAATNGFRPGELLLRYPGINVDAHA